MRILLGGSPCTHWSIAQKNNRETEPEGLGWELFKNYLIAKEKFKPDYFLYENNKSAAQPIKDQISKELGVDLMYINSALVSAQNRQRFYAFNWTVDQPEDRGILLKDILETGLPRYDKSPCIDANYDKGGNFSKPNCQSGRRAMCFEPVGTTKDGKAYCLSANYANGSGEKIGNYAAHTLEKGCKSMVAEPVCMCSLPKKVGEIEKGGQGNRIYSVDGKSVAQTAASGGIGSNTGLYAIPVVDTQTVQKAIPQIVEKYVYVPEMFNAYNKSEITDKSPTLSTGSMVTSSCATNRFESIQYYAIPVEWDENGKPTKAVSGADGKVYTVYEVKSGLVTIKDKQYPIKLPDGFYIIRKLTVKECARLQTIPDWYEFPVSDSQAYKMIGNGWTIEVIKYLLSHIPNIQNEEIEVLSMYDGMSCGQIALKELGCNVVRYYATEIDKFAIQTTQHNFPNTIQLGDAFQVRDSGWHL